MRLDDYQGYAIFKDPEELYSARKIMGDNTATNPWNYGEVEYTSLDLDELKKRIDTGDVDPANVIL